MQEVVYKDPEAKQNYTVDFTDILDDADSTLTGETAVATKTDGTTDATVIDTLSKSGLVLTVPLKAGSDGEDYVIIIKATGNSSGLIGVASLEMRVRVEEIGNF
ncbi:hypothetical protein LCGC14_2587310 [marine sediment metagenome]|uniref:Uncharacterized protein n=1 Tax=marine sediment metagenome TaxID=412755 RepID=A0A0F9ACM2_9ZZZZ